jgi:hypothetical protein
VKAFGAALMAAFMSCGGVEEEEYGWQPLHGEKHVTAKNGLTFYWTGAYGQYQTAEQASLAIDEAFLEWHQLYEAQHGFQPSRAVRTQHLQQISIQLFADWKVPGNSEAYEYGIWWPWQHQIDSAIGTPHHYDPYLGIHTQGVEQLKHEWMHAVTGQGH